MDPSSVSRVCDLDPSCPLFFPGLFDNVTLTCTHIVLVLWTASTPTHTIVMWGRFDRND